ncbi:Opacity protein [Verrucomicrobium sp. GAS474]|uniref:outer membrane protein n=1 Tax=Verrucomicrobium sp. GAS474 TaxID=1882831 RepID=UPI00087D945F|nr:hypothetical protein [Verrucomicrobium sp. GAS474]SDU01265.1 Opacity protein [Verrucomicrobium sp. GAS474]
MKTILGNFTFTFALPALTLSALLLAAPAQAQTTSTQPPANDPLGAVKTSPEGINSYPGFTPPPFKTSAEPRTMKTGSEVAVFGGIDFMQTGDFKETYTSGSARASWWNTTRTHMGTVFGAKAGYTWPGLGKGAGFGSEGPAEIDEDSKLVLLPSFEAEFFYSSHTYEGKGPVYGTGGTGVRAVNETDIRASMEEYVLTVNPVLRAQVWRFRPYVGAGVGAALVQLKNSSVASSYPQTGSYVNLNNRPADQTSICPVAQVEVGTDFFITKSVSIFGEYKFLALINPQFQGLGGFDYRGDYEGESIATAGIRYHF